MRKTTKLLVLIAVLIAIFAFSFTVSAEQANGWVDNQDGTWSYYQDGDMVYDEEIFYNGRYYRLNEYGIMIDGDWYYNFWDGGYYYYHTGGASAYGKVLVDGKYYLFGEHGDLIKGQAIEVKTSNGYECYYGDENGYPITLPNNKWKEIPTEWGTEWYYVQNGRLCHDGIYKIDGAYYCFYWGGSLVTETTFYADNKCFYCAENGVARELANNKWTKIGNDWYYVKNGTLPDGITTVDGKDYYFFSGLMAADDLIYANYYDEDAMHWVDCRYYAKPDGVLAKNEWFEYSDYWRYAGSDHSVYNNGLTKIGPYYYYFYNWYAAAQNEIIDTGDGIYIVGDNCRATKANGWFKHPISKQWMYAKGNELYREGVYTIDGVKYAFDWEGEMLTDTIKYYDGKYYLINANGEVVTTYGWQKKNGNHYFVNNDGTLAQGWLLNGGTWYYMQPAMSYCDLITEDGWLYYTNVNGEYKQITGNGFYNASVGMIYLKNNRIVTNKWEYISGKWYYFNEAGAMSCDGNSYIDGKWYHFDANGAMANNGWIRNSSGNWLYANPDGTLYTGKDSAGYLFDSTGYLQVNTTYNYNGIWYVTNADGKVIGSLKDNGWTKVNNHWYYVDYGSLTTGSMVIDGKYYSFDSQGRMRSGGIYESHFLNADGSARTGWIYYDGNWYYGDPDDYGWLYSEGVFTIEGKKYFFYNRVLQQNVTTAYYDTVVTTNADGVVTKEVYANGWTYNSLDSYGEVYYYENGKGYCGWKGDYYLVDGRLITDEIIEYKGKSYYLGVDGKYIRNGWLEIWGDYIFARGDGSLAKNEWIATNGGKYWYYFSDVWMVRDCTIAIDGVNHKFNADGVWVGEYKASSNKDGWVKNGNNWNFYMAGEKVCYQEIYDGGYWYYMDYNGTMVTNSFAYSHDNYSDYYYYDADGRRVNYTNWKKINGYWCYFNDKGYVTTGWIKDGNTYYYQGIKYIVDKDGDIITSTVAMITGYYSDGRSLYYFNKDGKYVKTITATGWYKSDEGDWYYVENGRLYTDGVYKIGDYYYAFYYDGEMVENEEYDGYYFGADGRKITKKGWNKVGKEYIYVNQNGYVAYNGIFLIDGKEYVFQHGYWLG